MEHFLLHLAKTSAIVGAVIALALILRPVLQKRFAAKARYWLWLVLAVALVPSPAYTGANAPVQITPPSEHVFVWPDKQAIAPKIVHKDVFLPEEITPALSSAAPVTDSGSVPQPVRRIVEVSSVLFWTWLAGVAVFLSVQGIGYAKLRRLMRRWSEASTNVRYGELLREEADALGVPAPKLTVCAPVPTPALTGLTHPTLLLPHENYAETDLRFILRHELYHLRRRDILYKSFLTFVNALHWFNPLVYLMLRAADEDIELSCDSAVTANMEKADRAAYSETLLKSVRERHGAVVLTTCFGSTVERLKRRLANVFDDGKKSRGVAVILLTVCAVIGLSAAIGFAPAETKNPPHTHGEYADVEDYLMHRMPMIGSEVSYYPYSADGTILEETAAKVLDRKLEWLNQTGEVRDLAPEGTLQSWKYNYLLQLDAPANGVRLVGGMHEEDGYFDLEGQGGHNLVVLQYGDGSIDVLYDQPVNDNMDFYGYHQSYDEAIYDWYVTHYNLDRTEYPLYVLDWRELLPDNYPAGNYPAHRYDGDGWYMYIPVNAWEPGVGEPIWYSSYGTESTIVVKSFDTPLSDAQAFFKREGWEGMNDDMIFVSYEDRFSNVYLYERPAGGHYEVQLFADFEKIAEIAESCPEADKETPILVRMAQSFTVDERFSPALWIDPLYADALLNAKPITYVDEMRSKPYFTTDILANLTRDDTHEYPEAPAAFAVVDLDRDGTAEVVYRRSDYRGYIVLHLYYGGVRGHELNYREMTSLKRDGSLLASGGAALAAINRIRFDGAEMVIERNEFGVDGSAADGVSNVTQEEFDERIAKFETRPNVTWYDWTEENVRSVLGTNRGTRTVAFDDIMGLSGFYSETTDGANFITRQYYVPAVVGGYTPIGESFGYTIDDHVVDLDGDGVTELICNCQYGADGAERVFVYRLDTREGYIEQGTYYPVYSALPNYNDWGVNSSAEYYDADADEFVLGYSTTHGVAEMAEKRFTYRLLDFVPYAFNDTPFPQPVLPEKVSADTATETQSRILEIDGKPVSLSAHGWTWYASMDGWICREKDGKTEKLYELPINYMTDTFVYPSLTLVDDYVTLTYHIGGATAGSDVTVRFLDDGSYVEMPVNSSTGTRGDLWVSISNFVPPERGNLRISRDGGKNWSAFGSTEILYGWTYTVEGDYKSNIRNGTMYFIDDAVYLLGTHLDAPFDGTPSVTRVCRVDLSTGETEMLTGEAKKFSIVGQWIHYTTPDGTGHTCPLTGDLVPTVKYPQTGKWKL